MKFFATSIIRQLDQFTIDHEPISSIDLMERAAKALHHEFKRRFTTDRSIFIFAGQGNNGGDALALARLLLEDNYRVTAYLFNPASSEQPLSPDCETNRNRLAQDFPDSLIEIRSEFEKPMLTADSIVVDGLFGSGLSRPLTGGFAAVVQFINMSEGYVVSIDIPSGLMGEENDLNDQSVIVQADLTLSLQFPKLSFFFAENEPFVGKWKVLDICLHPEAIEQTSSNLFFLEEADITPLLIKRPRFSHKGSFGHACLVAGSKGMAGAAVLSAKASLRSGSGLTSIYGPSTICDIIQTAIPEAIFVEDQPLSEANPMISYDAIAVGPGIGTGVDSQNMLRKFLESYRKPCILDADALNIIALQKEMQRFIPRNSILTPHVKEFERLFGQSKYSYQRIAKAQNAARQLGVIIILKGANTLIATPDRNLFFNSTGNAGMATAGAGDVLTGILVGLLAQGYSPEEAAKLGVFLHGRAGDIALENESEESLLAGDIIASLGKAFRSIR